MNGLSTLQPADRFTVIQFNSVHEALFDEPVSASEENLSQAQRYVRNLRATGGTEMLPALLAALSMPESSKHLRQVIFITDAAVGNEDQLYARRTTRTGVGTIVQRWASVLLPTATFCATPRRTGRETVYLHRLDQRSRKQDDRAAEQAHPPRAHRHRAELASAA